MPRFKVRCYERGTWDKIEPREVEARDERETAESVCGEPLLEAGKFVVTAEVGKVRSQNSSALYTR